MVDNLKVHITEDHLKLPHLTSNNINSNNIHSNSNMPIKAKISHLDTTKEVVMEIDEILQTTNLINFLNLKI